MLADYFIVKIKIIDRDLMGLKEDTSFTIEVF